ncbi:MAG TPA: ribosome small subunit-dependent GTPase A [Defluviitoga sp.]|nr:ribosome small subunit-dependent GTPase A [Defluviitoga sp.]HPZ29297.1 ribosome small subunit-dependent GTPase A [Defluviitoga sp.]HQD63207.1 ribosome small subunit-dependent GTPase A [Defluviitoga sp.]
MNYRKGIVIRFHSNTLTVRDLETHTNLECYMPGKFKIQKIRPIVGDYVEYYIEENNEFGVIKNILPRKNELYRPKVANVDQVVLVTSLKDPKVDYIVVDKFLVLVEKEKLEVVIVVNKIDLLISPEEKKELEEFINIYESLYPVIPTSKITKENIDRIQDVLKEKVTTLAGLSGVGKTSLLNMLDPDLKLREGEVSPKLGRGRHTTTFAQLLPLKFGGFVVDTPGFADLALIGIDKNEIKHYFPEFMPFQPYCAFSDCSHISEPDCAVKIAVENEEISYMRYKNYCAIYKEVEQQTNR